MTSNLDLIKHKRSDFNLLSKTIGIYCIDEESIKRFYEEIINRIPTDALRIDSCHYSEDYYVISLKDGTTYRFLLATHDNTRGFKFDELYLQKEVSEDIYNEIRCRTWDNDCIYVIEHITDFRGCNHRRANEYYANKYREKEE